MLGVSVGAKLVSYRTVRKRGGVSPAAVSKVMSRYCTQDPERTPPRLPEELFASFFSSPPDHASDCSASSVR